MGRTHDTAGSPPQPAPQSRPSSRPFWGHRVRSPSMEHAVAAFRDHLRSEKRASPHTLRAYLHDVGELAAFVLKLVGRAVTLGDLDPIACRSYLASLHGHNDAVTIGRKLSSLRAFFRFMVRRRLCAQSPVAALRAPKRAKRLPSFLGKDDVMRLLDGAPPSEEPAEEALRLRDEALLEVIYGAGLRVSEACNLDLDDITSDEVKVRQGKGRKDRVVPIGGKAPRAVDVYLRTRAAWLAQAKGTPPHGGALFVTPRGRRLDPRAVRRLLAKREVATGVRQVSPHALRHSFATHLLGAGHLAAGTPPGSARGAAAAGEARAGHRRAPGVAARPSPQLRHSPAGRGSSRRGDAAWIRARCGGCWRSASWPPACARCRRTPFATASPLTCWARGPICGRFKRCWDMPAFRRLSAMLTSTSIT